MEKSTKKSVHEKKPFANDYFLIMIRVVHIFVHGEKQRGNHDKTSECGKDPRFPDRFNDRDLAHLLRLEVVGRMVQSRKSTGRKSLLQPGAMT